MILFQLMSLFGKIFGGKREAPPPSTQESIQKLRETEDLLIKKQDFLEKKIKDVSCFDLSWFISTLFPYYWLWDLGAIFYVE